MFLRSEIAMPQFATLEIIGIKTWRAEPGDHALPIGRRGRRAIRIIVVSWFIFASVDSGLPKPFAGGFVEAHKTTSRAGGFTRRVRASRCRSLASERLTCEDAIAPDHRRGVARLRQRNAPAHVFVRAPVHGQIAFVRETGAVGTAPLRPISCERESGQKAG